MITNLILCIIIFSIIIYIIHNTNKKNVVEPFNVTEPINIDQNFKVDINKISKERSVRFSKNKVYNQSRVVYGFNDLEYFNKNIDNIFYFYGINDEKIKSYFREKYSLVNKNLNVDISKLSVADKKYYESLLKSNHNEVGIGIDNELGTKKIYILVDKNIFSLKKLKNNIYVESIYNDNYLIKKDEIMSYLGKPNFDIIDKYINLLKITDGIDLNSVMKKMGDLSKKENLNIDITGYKNYFDRDLSPFFVQKYKKIENLHCFTRYDNNKMMGYNFSLYDKELMVGDSKQFLFNLLKELGCNLEGFDNWIKENKDLMITYISFIKTPSENIVTVYYNNK